MQALRRLSFLAPLALCAAASAQSPLHSFGANELDGALRAGGPGWSAKLAASGVVVHPLLGARAAHVQHLALALESVERGAAKRRYDRSVAPVLDGQRITYVRGPELVEWYEPRADGLEQSFVLASRPAGDGDLVVRLAFETSLAAPTTAAWSERIELRHAGERALAVSAVLGIDAAGRTCAGDLRASAGALELRLPAAFVDSASYPLVLDPLYGPGGPLAAGGDAAAPALARHPLLDQYLAAWQVDLALDTAEIRAQRLDASGALLGSLVTVDAASQIYSAAPAVGFERDKAYFVVAYQQGPLFAGPFDIATRSVSGLGGVSAELALASTTANELAPCIGSEAASGQGDASLVLWNQVGNGIKGARVVPNAAGVPTLGGAITIPGTAGDDDQPALARTGGSAGLFLATWRAPGGVAVDALRATLIRRDGIVLTNPLVISVPGINASTPAVDGYPANAASARWLVAAAITEQAPSTDHDVRAWSLQWNGTALSIATGPVAVENGVNDDEIEPAVLWMGAKAFVAWSDESSGISYDAYFKGVDPNTCVVCESATALATGGGLHRSIALAGELPVGGGAASALGLAVWEQIDAVLPFDGDIWSRAITATSDSGSTQSLGGGCGGGGVNDVEANPSIGTGAFAFYLSGADPSSPLALLNITAPGAGVPIGCGACVWEPFFITQLRPLVAGSTSFPLAIPCDPTAVGIQLVTQWTVVLTSTTPCPLGANISLSDRLLITLGS
ncbi:MAG: hypothetical protein EPO68_06480 [Planctomycetota bacterium]|nr:MAG: hypothetical protein EPO68_06480 [Planctomycetota bacterium]